MPLRVTPEASGRRQTGRTSPNGPTGQPETTDEAAHIKITSASASSDESAAAELRSFDDLVELAIHDVTSADARAEGSAGSGAGAGASAGEGATGRADMRRVGIELEWLVVDVARPSRSVPPDETAAALIEALGTTGAPGTAGASARSGLPGPGPGPEAGAPASPTSPTSPASPSLPSLPGGSRLTFEPGGQLELSGPPLALADAVAAMRGDLTLVRGALARHGLGLAGLGVDPLRPPRRHTAASRYVAMEEHFRAVGGEAGLTMMCSTASVQVNLDSGADVTQTVERFRLAHALEPVLIAMFAASPMPAGQPLTWQSGRQEVWARIDPSRTGPVLPDPTVPPTEWNPRGGTDHLAWLWARYLHDAHLMMIAGDDGEYQAVGHRATFGDWLAGGRAAPSTRRPTRQDLGWHATTLFPPVRPRGWLELRYLDAQPSELWPVPVAVASVLFDDPLAAREALAASVAVAGRARLAARLGLRDPALHRAAVRCVDLAVEALTRAGGDPELRLAVEAFADRYTRRRRSPADDLSLRLAARGPAELLREEASQCVLVP
ncbi:glutamate--cysteine ligase [Parafrankia irregularis]|uniref:Glutamate--cysteine ligase EgtA n=1 Tax=Parafrankia irregularis TaxID=795642 RepID=A0A0S4QQ80_9ACTN|nr:MULTISPECIES: ergothioneine biosynthesis glutamate--cysteine ligase EgtA [Parafrankia]MBE3204307.1 ergothioneine biosynthesis glutamate--cysteine ligase EgtA [Parafrankia sp. CH37]CUU57279.1 glutamate--cysteine ligase [Parafrankia irregularis]